jgi:hypothetical protein
LINEVFCIRQAIPYSPVKIGFRPRFIQRYYNDLSDEEIYSWSRRTIGAGWAHRDLGEFSFISNGVFRAV